MSSAPDRQPDHPDETLGRLLRAAGHDLNNHLHVVLAATAALGTVELTADDQQMLVDVRQAAQSAGAVVDRLYALGRCLTEPAQPQELALLLADVELRLAEAGQLLVVDEPPDCTLLLDSQPATRVLTDLSQAAASDDGLVELAVSVSSEIRFGWPWTPALRLLVDRVLDPAAALPAPQLVTVLTLRSLVPRLGATLDPRTTRLELVLPVGPPAASAAAAPRGPVAATSRRVLLVDDDQLVAEYLERALRRRGWEVCSASDGEAAWELVLADPRPFALVVADVQMPRLRGDQLLQRLAAHGRHWPALVVTGYSHREALDNLAALGHHVVLDKPFSDDLLDAALAQVLAGPPPPAPPPR
ncbi:MAG: response regulator [Fimbriimonadaceae bacterium]|nr:response regulator [Fimbriimonadaceae bacterium]